MGASGDLRALDELITQTDAVLPILVPWIAQRPRRALDHVEVWSDVLATVRWIHANRSDELYLRQIDVDGVDTKFVERHRALLDELLVAVLPAERIDTRFGISDFAARFRFQTKPEYARFRLLSPEPSLPRGVSELRMRSDELAEIQPAAVTVFIIENEVTYLAFPAVPDAIVMFGSGYALHPLRRLSWLDHKQLVYWGDIDTHGFAILSNLRSRFAEVRSILMDRHTLLAHPRQWVGEPAPTNRALPNLTEEEQALYRDLVEGHFGPAVRLEQERVRFSLVRQALQPWMA